LITNRYGLALGTILVLTGLLPGCASESPEQKLGRQISKPGVRFDDINDKPYTLDLQKIIGSYAIYRTAGWELVFKGQNLVYANKISAGSNAEHWVQQQIQDGYGSQFLTIPPPAPQ
jgi:hypothetical protein